MTPTSLLAGQVAVVALLQGDAHLVGGLHLELVHGLTGTGDNQLVAAVTVARHNFCLSFFLCLVWILPWMEHPRLSCPPQTLLCAIRISCFRHFSMH